MNRIQIAMGAFEEFRTEFERAYPTASANKLLLHWWAFRIHETTDLFLEMEHQSMLRPDPTDE